MAAGKISCSSVRLLQGQSLVSWGAGREESEARTERAQKAGGEWEGERRGPVRSHVLADPAKCCPPGV